MRSQVAGPMWMGKLHDVEFVGKMLGHIQENPDDFATAARIEGMLSVAQSVRLLLYLSNQTAETDVKLLLGSQELEAPFYFTPGRLSGSFHCTSPSLVLIVYVSLSSLSFLLHRLTFLPRQERPPKRRLQGLARARRRWLSQNKRSPFFRLRHSPRVDQNKPGEDGECERGESDSEITAEGSNVRHFHFSVIFSFPLTA